MSRQKRLQKVADKFKTDKGTTVRAVRICADGLREDHHIKLLLSSFLHKGQLYYRLIQSCSALQHMTVLFFDGRAKADKAFDAQVANLMQGGTDDLKPVLVDEMPPQTQTAH